MLALSHAETITTRDLPVHLLTNRRNHPDLVQLPEEGLDLEAYLHGASAVPRLRVVFAAMERCNTEDPGNWQELTGASRADLRKSLGVSRRDQAPRRGSGL